MTWLIDTLLVTGGLLAVVLAVRGPVARLFGPAIAYALWLLPVLRLLVPPLTLPAKVSAVPAAAEILITSAPVRPAAVMPGALSFTAILTMVWLGGALIFLLRRGYGYWAMRQRLLIKSVDVGRVRRIQLIETPAARSPVAFGLIDPIIALPPGFMAQQPQVPRDLAIRHELEHHRGRDLWINVAAQPLLALHWFNPLAWLAWRALRRDQEAACDARVMAGHRGEMRQIYGQLLADFARLPLGAPDSPLACPIHFEKNIIHRLRSLTMTEPSPTRRRTGRLMIGVAALALPLTATISYAAPDAPPAPPTPGVEAAVVKVETAAPATPDAPPQVRKIVIMEGSGTAEADEAKLNTRTVTRDGRTYVFKTAKPLGDAEVEERIARIAAGEPVIADKFVVSTGPDGAVRSGQTVERREVRTMVTHFDTKGKSTNVPVAVSDCPAGTHSSSAQADTDQGENGKTRHVRVLVCAHSGDQQGRLHGLRSARAKVAANPEIPAEAKAEVLQQLDAEIEQAAKAG